MLEYYFHLVRGLSTTAKDMQQQLLVIKKSVPKFPCWSSAMSWNAMVWLLILKNSRCLPHVHLTINPLQPPPSQKLPEWGQRPIKLILIWFQKPLDPFNPRWDHGFYWPSQLSPRLVHFLQSLFWPLQNSRFTAAATWMEPESATKKNHLNPFNAWFFRGQSLAARATMRSSDAFASDRW